MADKGSDFQMPEGEYAGDVTAKSAWQTLESDTKAVLVDVRTKVEWQLIGKPDLSTLDKEPGLSRVGHDERDQQEFRRGARDGARGTWLSQKDAPLIFMCQSGGRSKVAAMQLHRSRLFGLLQSRGRFRGRPR